MFAHLTSIKATRQYLPDARANLKATTNLQDFTPRTVAINGQKCALGLRANVSAPVPSLPQSTDGPTPELSTFLQTGYVSISGNRLVGVDGNLLTLNGVNWFGFETQARHLVSH